MTTIKVMLLFTLNNVVCFKKINWNLFRCTFKKPKMCSTLKQSVRRKKCTFSKKKKNLKILLRV
jgi:hypothetical protein